MQTTYDNISATEAAAIAEEAGQLKLAADIRAEYEGYPEGYLWATNEEDLIHYSVDGQTYAIIKPKYEEEGISLEDACSMGAGVAWHLDPSEVLEKGLSVALIGYNLAEIAENLSNGGCIDDNLSESQVKKIGQLDFLEIKEGIEATETFVVRQTDDTLGSYDCAKEVVGLDVAYKAAELLTHELHNMDCFEETVSYEQAERAVEIQCIRNNQNFDSYRNATVVGGTLEERAGEVFWMTAQHLAGIQSNGEYPVLEEIKSKTDGATPNDCARHWNSLEKEAA